MSRTPPPDKRFIITVDDPGGLIQDLDIFHRARQLFDEEGVPASFFVVPRGEGDWRLDRQSEWLATLQDAERGGHDCQLHGLDHANCEFGPYPAMIRALGGNDPEESLRGSTERFGHLWRRDIFVEKLQTARDIFHRAFGRWPLVLRTGALSQTPDLYLAAAEVGQQYVSNSVIDPRGWKYIIEEYDDPGDWDPQVPPGPYWLTDDVINLPIISEYAWYLTPEKIDPHLALAVEDLGRVYDAGGVFILVCHVQCVGAEDDYARILLRRLIEIARQEHQVTFHTVSDLVAAVESGAVPVTPKPAR